MPYDTSTGIYTPPDGAENAFAGEIIRSATWNSIFTDISAALTQLGTGVFVNGPRIISSSGNFTVAATDEVIYIRAPAPTITMPLAANKTGPVTLLGAASTIFGSNTSKVLFTGGELGSGNATLILNANYQTITLYPQTGGYILGSGSDSGNWVSFTPVIGAGGGSGVITTNLTGRWKLIDPKTVVFNISFLISSTGGASGVMPISLPAFSLAQTNGFSVISGVDCTSGIALAAYCIGGNNALAVNKYDGSTAYANHAFAFNGCCELGALQ